MAVPSSQEWFELKEIRRRKLATAVWVPLRRSETILRRGNPRHVGHSEEVACVGSVAVSPAFRDIGNTLGWHEIGLMHSPRPYAFEDGRYKPADVFLYNDRDAVGVELVVVNSLNSDHIREWQVNQDLVIALGLFKEGDIWKRADEGYIDVIRERRDATGTIVSIDMRVEYLRDYLCARDLALRVAQYYQRTAVVADASHLEWNEKGLDVKSAEERFTTHVSRLNADGSMPGGIAIMKVWRNDVDDEQDAPVFGPESDSNTDFVSYTAEGSRGPYIYRVAGELWRQEWIEPAAISERVRGDRRPDEFFFIVGPGGERQSSSQLNDEDILRWLWFQPQVIEALLQFRGSQLEWYTRNTGSIRCSPDYKTHFGVDRLDCINVYAYDIAKLPHWQQRIWAGHNIAPNGPVATELLDSQMRAEPARTTAPEEIFNRLLHAANGLFQRRFGAPLLRYHEAQHQVMARVHRFRGIEKGGVLALAKDLSRLTADSIDIGLLRQILRLSHEVKLGSLKLLENVLAMDIGPDEARIKMAPWFAIYELRLGDAHLPSSKVEDSLRALRIDVALPPVTQAVQLIGSANSTLEACIDAWT